MTIQLDHEELHRLLAALANSDIQEFRLEGQDFRLEVKRNMPSSSSTISTSSSSDSVAVAPVIKTAQQQVTVESEVHTTPSPPPPSGAGSRSDLVEITAPMVGTFYRKPAPDKEPFVQVGQKISKGDTVCIIEAMKLFNEIESEVDGVVEKICVNNGDSVEFGQTLFLIK